MRIKIGKVNYLNTLPLFYDWDLSQVELVEGHPSELVIKLRKGEIEGGIVSSVEYLLNKENYIVVPNVCIASRERACSVYIFSKKPLEEISSIYLTRASMTARKLALYIVREIYKKDPEILEDKNKAQALMLIGDEAIREKQSKKWEYLYDLGLEWFKVNKLPFVFALFLVRKDIPSKYSEYIAEQCQRSKKKFFEDLEAGNIVVEGFDAGFVHDYFNHCLQYELDNKAWKSLELFNGILMKYNL